MKKTLFSTMCALATMTASAQVMIDVDAAQRGPKISPTHYGIFFEDINHAADGGLYAELIRNRSFEDGDDYGKPATMEAWSVKGGAKAKLIQPSKKVKLLNSVQGNALELTLNATAASPACLVNEGFWGINTVMGRSYKLSFYAKGTYNGQVKAVLCDSLGKTVYAETVISNFAADKKSKQWKKYTATLTATANDAKGRFALVFDGKGVINLDMVSLFPPTFKNRENGLRPDLAQMLYEMHPKFMRFPGGCFVEGQVSPENAFHWERTIGPIEERPGHWNVNWGYRTTDGIGFHEYLQMAEDLGAKPLYVVNIGLWHGGLTPVDSIQPWIDECLAALEYANGDVTTKYGAMRAKNGHPAPFNIEYLEIGNENNQPIVEHQSDRYYERYDKFRKAIREKYPNIKLIGNVVAWGDDNPKWNSTLPVDLLDEHYYRNPAWFADTYNKYDSYPRQLADGSPAPRIYVGEYAVTSGFGNLGNMNAALGEAVYMMGIENNSDIVPLNSYAPIFVNENDAKWRPDMIRFNSSRVMGTPSYYVQQLMPQHIGTQVVKVKQQNPYEQRMLKRTAITPEQSSIGYATWHTKASFVSQEGNNGQPVVIRGQWKRDADGVLHQLTTNEKRCIAINPQTVGDHYTAKFRCRKDEGNEGFMIVFNYVDEENFWWVNFGGWDNTQHGLEHVSGGGKSQVELVEGKIETGRWYDVTLQVHGDSLKCWLDKELVFDTVLRGDTKAGIFSSATIDENSGELIVKVVNTSEDHSAAVVNVSNFNVKSAQLTRLAANDGMDENTLQQPTNIYPTHHELSPDGNKVAVDLPAYSLNIIRIAPKR
ncbi:MAG: carbohydrate binding domain-containing protein [Prevotella sp.]|nr:carbohydrate binding domain-containing protein [Prevotella sp.]